MYIQEDEPNALAAKVGSKYLVDVKATSGLKPGGVSKHYSTQIEAESGTQASSSKKQYLTHTQRIQARLAASTDEENTGTSASDKNMYQINQKLYKKMHAQEEENAKHATLTNTSFKYEANQKFVRLFGIAEQFDRDDDSSGFVNDVFGVDVFNQRIKLN